MERTTNSIYVNKTLTHITPVNMGRISHQWGWAEYHTLALRWIIFLFYVVKASEKKRISEYRRVVIVVQNINSSTEFTV